MPDMTNRFQHFSLSSDTISQLYSSSIYESVIDATISKTIFILVIHRWLWEETSAWLEVLTNASLSLRFSTGFAYYSLAMGVEEFGVNIYILQIIFGGVDIPAKFITILSLSYLGRRITQSFLLLLAGGAILALIFVPSGERLP